MRKLILAALAVIALGVLPLVAQSQSTPDTFTLFPTPSLTVIPGASFYTYALSTFDGAAMSGQVSPCGLNPNTNGPLTCGEYDFLSISPSAGDEFEFDFPTVQLDDCSRTSDLATPLNLYGATYQTQTTTDEFSCSGYKIETVRVVHYMVVAGSGRGGHRQFATLTPLLPITGTLTKQQEQWWMIR